MSTHSSLDYMKQWHAAHPEKRLQYAAAFKAKRQALSGPEKEAHLAYQRKANKESHTRDRQACFNAYGKVCACCQEATYEFLGIDHVEGSGTKHRREVGNNIYRWLKRNGFPPGFQTLCHNCNMAKGFYGACPHKDKV